MIFYRTIDKLSDNAEPTDEMIQAGLLAYYDVDPRSSDDDERLRAAFLAMLSKAKTDCVVQATKEMRDRLASLAGAALSG